MGRNTRQTNSTIKELTFGANTPYTTSFVRQHFQEVCRLHSFNQGSMRLYMHQSFFDAVVHASKLFRCGCTCIKAFSMRLYMHQSFFDAVVHASKLFRCGCTCIKAFSMRLYMYQSFLFMYSSSGLSTDVFS